MPGSACPTPPADAGTVAGAVTAALASHGLAGPDLAGPDLAGPGGRLFVGFSGGLDSSVLLHALSRLCPERLIAVHVDHGLQPMAADWAHHCATMAGEWGVPCLVREVRVERAGSLEAGARQARYGVFAGLLNRPDDRLVLAHHYDDQLETVLLRLLQGRGGYGMPAARPLAAGHLLRPLLGLPRSALAAYARHWRLRWVEDPSNADISIARNRLRRTVLPALRARDPAIDLRIGELQRRGAALDTALRARDPALASGAPLPLTVLAAAPAAARAELLRLWLDGQGSAVPPRRALDEFCRQLLTARRDRQPQLAVAGAILRVHGGRLHRVPALPPLAAGYAMPASGLLRLPHGVLQVVPDDDGPLPQGALRVMFRCGGERLVTPGGSRRVKDLLREAGLPAWEREALPLLFDDAGVLSIPGVAARAALRPRADAGVRALWSAQRQLD